MGRYMARAIPCSWTLFSVQRRHQFLGGECISTMNHTAYLLLNEPLYAHRTLNLAAESARHIMAKVEKMVIAGQVLRLLKMWWELSVVDSGMSLLLRNIHRISLNVFEIIELKLLKVPETEVGPRLHELLHVLKTSPVISAPAS